MESLAQACFAALLTGYALGSIPTAYWLCLLWYRKNILDYGSKNMGATNVHRVFGLAPFAVTLNLDILKGMAAVLISARYAPDAGTVVAVQLVAGLGAILGHTLSFWIRFRGGKGVATGLGVFLALAPKAPLSAMGIFLAVLLLSRFVSLGSMCAAVSLPLLIWKFQEGGAGWNLRLIAFSSIVALFVVFKHRANVRRLLKGEELALPWKGTPSESAAPAPPEAEGPGPKTSPSPGDSP